ncbi:MAG: NAD(P)-dependent oxidoreductase [Armatimonadetes bacterium]|nr:NAD(P)-dependent oxidoreductase [Armatimonadota bacterium]
MNVAIFGAGGPVAAGAIAWLADRHTLRLTDIASLDTPHEYRRVDVTDPDQVAAAAEGMDALINCTVMRPDPVLAFDVNTRGAYNVMRAAVMQSVPRVVHTGPAQIFATRGGYQNEWNLTEEAPPRPGVNLYAWSKYLGHEIVRTFARCHPEISTVVFYYAGFYSDEPEHRGPRFAVHVDDAGQAFRLGVEVPREQLPSNFELFHISADVPMAQVSVEKARRILGYAPRHNFEHVWSRRARAAYEGSGGNEARPG